MTSRKERELKSKWARWNKQAAIQFRCDAVKSIEELGLGHEEVKALIDRLGFPTARTKGHRREQFWNFRKGLRLCTPDDSWFPALCEELGIDGNEYFPDWETKKASS